MDCSGSFLASLTPLATLKMMSNHVISMGEQRHNKIFPAHAKHSKYPNVPGDEFCGSKPGTYPVDTLEHVRAVLMLAHYDPHPEKVRACALKRLKALKSKATAKTKTKTKVKK